MTPEPFPKWVYRGTEAKIVDTPQEFDAAVAEGFSEEAPHIKAYREERERIEAAQRPAQPEEPQEAEAPPISHPLITEPFSEPKPAEPHHVESEIAPPKGE